MPSTSDIVARLWSLCHVLRDDGVTYQAYVTELTYLLFLKMAQETKTEGRVAKGYRWADLKAKNEGDVLTFYRKLLIDLGIGKDQQVAAIFSNASTMVRQPKILKKLGKGTNLKNNIDCIGECLDSGIIPVPNIIIGFPEDCICCC